MGEIGVNPVAAQDQATKIAQAGDKLTITREITLSSETTIQGNENAKSSCTTLKHSLTAVQGLLTRDVLLSTVRLGHFNVWINKRKK